MKITKTSNAHKARCIAYAKKRRAEDDEFRLKTNEDKRLYYHRNKEKISQQRKERYQKNKEKILNKCKERVNCNFCGNEYCAGYIWQHKKTCKALKFLMYVSEAKRTTTKMEQQQ